MLRQALLQYLDRVGKDVVRVDDERAICRVKNVTSKRIVKPLLLSVVQKTVACAEQSPRDDAVVLHARSKQLLREEADVVSWKGNVLPLDSAEARRKTRDEAEVRHGEPGIVDPITLQLVDTYWDAVTRRANLKKEEAQSPPVAMMEEQATPPKEEAPPPAASPPRESTVNAAPARVPRPRSSVSKKEAASILQKVAEFIVEHRGEAQLLRGSYAVLHQCWPMTR